MLRLNNIFIHITIIISSFMVFGLSGCATPYEVEELNIPIDFKQVVAISGDSRRWILPVTINDKPLNLVLDTGSTQIALFENQNTKHFFDDANTFTKTRAFDRSGPPVKSQFMEYATLRMNGFPQQTVKIALFNREKNPFFPFQNIDGIIGYELLSQYDVRIDNQKKIATFMKAGTLTKSNDTYFIPLKIIGKAPVFSGKLSFPFANVDKNLSVTVDTGSTAEMIIFTPEDVSVNMHAAIKQSYILSISGLEKYIKFPDTLITSSKGNFSFTGDASVKTIEKINGHVLLGLPAFSKGIVEISYKSRFVTISK